MIFESSNMCIKHNCWLNSNLWAKVCPQVHLSSLKVQGCNSMGQILPSLSILVISSRGWCRIQKNQSSQFDFQVAGWVYRDSSLKKTLSLSLSWVIETNMEPLLSFCHFSVYNCSHTCAISAQPRFTSICLLPNGLFLIWYYCSESFCCIITFRSLHFSKY